MLDDIATYLSGKNIKNIYKGFMPDKPDDVVGLFEYAGEPMELTMGSGAVLERPGLQVRVRSADYSSARSTIDTIIDALHGNTGLFLLIRANQSPESIGLDANYRSELVVNFSIMKERVV